MSAPAAARADHESGHNESNTPPVAAMEVRDYLEPGHFVYDQYELDATGSHDPDGHIETTRFLSNGEWVKGQASSTLRLRWMESGWQQVGVEVTDDHGATDVVLRDVLVAWRSPPSGGSAPWADPLRKRPTALFVPRYYRTAKLNRRGLPVRIECSYCVAEVELQLTRYRARRLGMSGRFPSSKIGMAHAGSTFRPRPQHQFRLRPAARFRKALRRRRRVPILLSVRVRNIFGSFRTIGAEIELRR
jgi:hypothetical protein